MPVVGVELQNCICTHRRPQRTLRGACEGHTEVQRDQQNCLYCDSSAGFSFKVSGFCLMY